jgi:hypothetical protein
MTQATQTSGIDAARLSLMLNDLRLPAIKQDWPGFAERADKESWPAARLLAALAEHEIAERDRRRLARHLVEAQFLPGKTFDSFDFNVVPMISKAHILAICAGDSWIEKGANVLLIGGPGGGKTHLASAIGIALVENGLRVMFARTSDLVQRLQVARRRRSLRPPCDDLRDQRRQLSPTCRARPQKQGRRSTPSLRDNQRPRSRVAHRQSTTDLTLARGNHRRHHAHVAIIFSHLDRRKFSSRLPRYTSAP